MYEITGQKKPQIYRECVRKDYLRLPKSKKRSARTIRSVVRKQLQYICRDIGYVAELVQKGAKLSSKQAERLNIITTVYEQQRIMLEPGIHSIPLRIVSLVQPWVRPIVRETVHSNTEFGPNLHISLVVGYSRIERLDFEPFNESETSGERRPDIWNAFGRTRSTAAARCWPFAKCSVSVCLVPPWASRQKIGYFRNRKDRLWSGPHHGTPSRNYCLYH